ncbi:Kazal-type serine protease inhibitor domain-containing protein [Bacteriovorax sp. PP10]|uniref:Kazal-type serine protease inhibitor domain-containing protein n=1 Tax=Bacteriovorax antarcticus TaxID=3088717 RepID=A0ABU5VPG1_9BACT|nr:Kazal-type serine protease inhibitor domain-containing protein [Bacteriovorax sp. PP10]MEA9354822.1 Kazal-type serine protease inhibitor domain-containing protein [Bacteriovorax sp. PP10]
MKRMSQILYSLGLLTLVILSSCGKDNSTSTAGSSVSTFNGECSFTSEYSPVCGVNNITYDNISIAKCYNVTQTSPGNCICSERPVCGDNGVTYTECDAQDAYRQGKIKRIVKFTDCRK